MLFGREAQEVFDVSPFNNNISVTPPMETYGIMEKKREAVMYQRKLEKDIRCPLEYGMELFGGKWNSRIICVLAGLGTLRYSELRRELGNITDAVLASTLKSLISNGIVARKSYDEIPPRVEYSLTEKGASVVPILQSICSWAGVFYKDEGDAPMIQCQKCDHRG